MHPVEFHEYSLIKKKNQNNFPICNNNYNQIPAHLLLYWSEQL